MNHLEELELKALSLTAGAETTVVDALSVKLNLKRTRCQGVDANARGMR